MTKAILQLVALALFALSPAIAFAGEESLHPADAAASGSGRYVVTLKVESSEAGAVSEELIRKHGCPAAAAQRTELRRLRDRGHPGRGA